ncbi:predicted protein [Plenodomus lingam JN3]|uniref:Predicted protein n=1 Tax=Leptosphaeria maculans (strain JN3 / isolate v23.1.3 / race Av1-4-5-6-7-8) TaxID=985895 RepID=E4ZJ80_LEPMJ|nr:predicted protein [Plenodomus lingam JN3]CBX91511.1 predicted protein [Plenodomus lingam JN3]
MPSPPRPQPNIATPPPTNAQADVHNPHQRGVKCLATHLLPISQSHHTPTSPHTLDILATTPPSPLPKSPTTNPPPPVSSPLPAQAPPRRSLGRHGIPPHRDALAVYIHWARQRYYIARGHSGTHVPHGVAAGTAAVTHVYDEGRSMNDLRGVGAQFGEGVVGLGYPIEIEV